MRSVNGFDRPVLQWLFLAMAALLVVMAAAEAVALRRTKARVEALHAADLENRLDRQELEMRLAREQSAREALSREVARLRAAADGPAAPPALTLLPLSAPSATPPEPTVDEPGPLQLIELRLALPAAAASRGIYAMTIRGWSGGPPLWTRGGLTPSTVGGQEMVVAHLPGAVLERGAYEILLSTTGSNGQPAHAASYHVAVR